jgi:hypothetical protein
MSTENKEDYFDYSFSTSLYQFGNYNRTIMNNYSEPSLFICTKELSTGLSAAKFYADKKCIFVKTLSLSISKTEGRVVCLSSD